MNKETHTACGLRILREGGEATCCYCNPHEDCEINEPQP